MASERQKLIPGASQKTFGTILLHHDPMHCAWLTTDTVVVTDLVAKLDNFFDAELILSNGSFQNEMQLF